jgi:hypothetical protein
VYQQAAKDGIVTCLAFGAKIPKKWAKQDGTVFGDHVVAARTFPKHKSEFLDASRTGIARKARRSERSLAFGAKIPKKWAKQDGTVFGGIKAEQWDGL